MPQGVIFPPKRRTAIRPVAIAGRSMGTEIGQGLGRSMARGTAGLMVQRVVEMVVGLFIVPFTLAHLGEKAYGLWALFYAVMSYLNLADLGFAAALNHHFITAREKQGERRWLEMISSSLAYLMGTALVVFALGLALEGWVLSFFQDAEEFGAAARWVWRAHIFVLVLGFLGSYGRSLFYITHRISTLALINSLLALVNAGVTVFVLLQGWHLMGLAAGAATVAVLRQTIVFIVGGSGVEGWRPSFRYLRWDVIRLFLRFGSRVFVARTAEVINHTWDRVLLGRLAGLRIVTHYDLGGKAANTLNTLPYTALPVVEPAAAQLSAQGRHEELNRMLLRVSRYMGLLAFSLISMSIVLAAPLLTLWLGAMVEERSVLTLQFIVCAYMLASLVGPLRFASRGMGFPGWEARSAVVQAVVNVALSTGLWFVLGFQGVLLGTVIAAAVGQGLFLVLFRRGVRGFRMGQLVRAWFRPLATAVVAGAGAWIGLQLAPGMGPAPDRLSALVPIGAGVAGFVLLGAPAALLLKAITLAEVRDLLRQTFGREA